MRYSIMGFNQQKLLEIQTDNLKLDINDILLMDYIQKALSHPKMKKIIDEDNQPYVWLQHNKILEDLPILDIKERALQYRLEKLCNLGLIKFKCIANDKCRGTRTYYTITEIFVSLQFSEDDLTTRNELHMENRPDAMNCVSNSLLNLDNKLNNTILKDSETGVSISGNSNTLVNNRPKRTIPNINDDFSDKEYKEEKKEKKRLNLYDKCLAEINNFTEDAKLRDALVEYLTIRLKMKDKPIYGVGQWKGLLATLGQLAGDKAAIVKRATERGWGAFYELKDFQYKKNSNREVFAEDFDMGIVDPKTIEGGGFSGQVF